MKILVYTCILFLISSLSLSLFSFLLPSYQFWCESPIERLKPVVAGQVDLNVCNSDRWCPPTSVPLSLNSRQVLVNLTTALPSPSPSPSSFIAPRTAFFIVRHYDYNNDRVVSLTATCWLNLAAWSWLLISKRIIWFIQTSVCVCLWLIS